MEPLVGVLHEVVNKLLIIFEHAVLLEKFIKLQEVTVVGFDCSRGKLDDFVDNNFHLCLWERRHAL